MSIPAGGASTVNGILYQLLCSLAHAARMKLRADHDGEEIISATIVLEPSQGGDLQVDDGGIAVEQIKTRSGGKSWSLRDLVEDVLPDLYLATKLPKEVSHYRFVTDGRRGDWENVAQFFASLKDRDANEKGVLGCLNDSEELRFRRPAPSANPDPSKKKTPFWDQPRYTELLLFERIVREVRQRESTRDEPIEDTRSNVFKMLQRLEFVWGLTEKFLIDEVESMLRAVAPAIEQVPALRQSLTTALVELARKGDAKISATKFFSDHGLDAIPLSNWVALRRRAASVLATELKTRSYEADADVRSLEATSIRNLWSVATPVVAISGDTGYGKTWRLMALAENTKPSNLLPVFVESRGNIDDTILAAEKIISERVWGLDNVLSLDRIAERRSKVVGDRGAWLALLIDGVQSGKEAKALATRPWEDWGVRVAITCSTGVANRLLENTGPRVAISEVGLFSIQETQQFLERRMPGGWSNIPRDVMHMLRRPLLARLYVESVGNGAWESTNEYELYNSHWRRILSSSALEAPLAAACLKRLVRRFLDGGHYPWSGEDLLDCGINQDCISHLQMAGWLQIDSEGRFMVTHDRLLNWVVAVTLTDDVATDRLSVADLGKTLKQFNSRDAKPAGRYLGYVPMDVIWLMAQNCDLSEHLPTIIAALEGHHVQTEDLYTKLIPTIGSTLVAPLARLLQDRKFLLFAQRPVIAGLCRLESAKVVAKSLEFLRSGEPRLQRYALLMLKEHPTSECLDDLWDVWRRAARDPSPWLEEHDSKHLLNEQVFDALKASSQIDPDWIVQQARLANAEEEPVHTLASLVACISHRTGKRVWKACKENLLAKVDNDHTWTIARCMSHFPTKADSDWLRKCITERENIVVAYCMMALTRIDPDIALECLRTKPLFDWQSAPSWWLPELWALRPDATHEQLRVWASKKEHVWDVVKCYRGHEHELRLDLFDIVLEALSEVVNSCLGEEKREADRWLQQFEFFTTMNTKPQLERLRKHKGSVFEEQLTELVVQLGPREGVYQDSLARAPLMGILFLIGGDGYTKAANSLLASESEWAVSDGLNWAMKRPNQETLDACEAITRNEQLWDDKTPFAQNAAATILASEGQYEAVYEHIEQRWPKVYTSLTEPIEAGEPLPGEIRTRAIQAIEASGEAEVSPGTIELIGLSKSIEDLPLLRQLLIEADPDEEIAAACLLSMYRIGDQTEESVPHFERCLDSKNAHLARNALAANHAGPAYESLLRHYDQHFEVALAINLLNEPQTKEFAIELTQRHLANRLSPFDVSEVGLLVDHVREDDTLEAVFSEQQLRDRLLDLAFAAEGRSWFVGTKDAAIRAVAVFDLPTAVRAAQEALENFSGHDRERYPYTLAELMGDEAASYLLDQLAREPSGAVQASMRRALATVQASDVVAFRLKSDEAEQIIAGCRAVESDVGGQQGELLITLIGDERDGVRSAALDALKRIRRLNEADQVLDELRAATDTSTQWYWASALLELVDPGDQHRPLPEWMHSFGENFSPYVWQWIAEKLKKRRKSLFEKLSKANH